MTFLLPYVPVVLSCVITFPLQSDTVFQIPRGAQTFFCGESTSNIVMLKD
jgi:hypothetical protein